MKISWATIVFGLLASAGLGADCASCHKAPLGRGAPISRPALNAPARQRPAPPTASEDQYFAWSKAALDKAESDEDADDEDESFSEVATAVADNSEIKAKTSDADQATQVARVTARKIVIDAPEPTAKEIATDAVANVETDDAIGNSVDADVAAPTIKAWPQAGNDLKADPNAVFGTLDNGLRYVIRPTKAQPGRASFRLHMDVGSFMENDDQRGIAHFLEHMAFNGSKRFPAGETLEFFQRLGLSFGAHTNAETNFDTTVYMLELPRTNQETITAGIQFFRDVLDGLLLDAKEIEKERGVVLREMTSGNSAGRRKLVAEAKFALTDTRMDTRMPIGTAECISTMPRERFVEFYETWYRPERAVVIVVGDVKVDAIRSQIESEFADAKARRASVANPDLGTIPSGQGVTAAWHTEQDAATTTVALTLYLPAKRTADSVAHQRELLVRGMANMMLNARLQKLTGKPSSLAQSAQTGVAELFNFTELATAIALCDPAQTVSAVGLLEREIRRASEYGFTPSELADAKAKFVKIYEQHLATADTRAPGELAEELVHSVTTNTVFTDPAEDMRVFNEMLATLQGDECLAALRAAWASDDIRIFVSSSQPAPEGIEKKLASAYKLSKVFPVSAPEDSAAEAWAYTDFGPAATIAERREVKDLDLVQARLSNNVRVNVKRTAFDKNTVLVQLTFGGGLLEAPQDKPGLPDLAQAAFIGGGLQKHTAENLKRALIKQNVGVVFSIGEDSFELFGQCASGDLESQLQLCTAYLAAPGFRADAANQFQKSLDGLFAQIEHTPEGVMQRQVVNFLRGGDKRWGTPDRETFRARSLDEVKAWLAGPLAKGYLEVTVVGDVDPEQAITLVAKTLGALPEREATKPDFAAARQVKFPRTATTRDIHFKADAPRAMILCAWPTTDGIDFVKECQLQVLSSVLGDRVRVKVREELGAAYSPKVYSFSSEALPGYGFIGAEMIVEPRQAADVAATVATIGAELKDGQITADEFDRAIKPQLGNVSQAATNNYYWRAVLAQSQARPALLDSARTLEKVYQSITKDDIEKLAKEYLGKDQATIVTLTPDKAGEAPTTAAATSAVSR